MYRTEDLSTRARIRDAALTQFATYGFKGATVRGIADGAGVSAGLVQHHFPSKAALRDACDDYVLGFLRLLQEDTTRWRGEGALGYLTETLDVASPVVRYLAASLLSSSEDAGRWFDELVKVSRSSLVSGELGEVVGEEDDVDAVSAVMTAMQLGVAVMYEHVLRTLGAAAGEGRSEADAAIRVGRAKLFLAPERLVRPSLATAMRDALDAYERSVATPDIRGRQSDGSERSARRRNR